MNYLQTYLLPHSMKIQASKGILNDIHFLNFNSNLDRNYWEFFRDPNYDTSREGSANIETLGQPSDIKANS